MRKIITGIAVLALSLGMAVSAFAADVVSFNKASAEEIVKGTSGIVDAPLAKAIVDYRTANGPFKTVDDVKSVPGMRAFVLNSLDLKLTNGDVVYAADLEPAMKPY